MTTLQHTQRYRAGGVGPGPDLGPMSNAQGLYGATPPALSSVLFDFDPAFSMTEDRIGGLSLTNTGSVAKVIANGRVAAEFDGSNYLSSSSPFAALSDLTGGCSIYVVAEDTGSASNGMPLAILNSGATTAENAVRVYRNGTSDQWASQAWDGSASRYALGPSTATDNVVTVIGGHSTTTTRAASLWGLSSSTGDTAGTVDPSGMDTVRVGAGIWAGAAAFHFTGRVYRVLICEGAHDQAIADYLADLYTPLRLPPGLDASTVAFVWDARHNPFRDTLTGVDLSVTSVPTVESRGGDVAMVFDGTDDYLLGTLSPALGDLDGTLTAYVVQDNQAASISYPWGLTKSTDRSNEYQFCLSRDTATTGCSAYRAEGGAQVQDHSGGSATLGDVELLSAEWTASQFLAALNGTANAATADTTVPRGIDEISIGRAMHNVLWCTGGVFYLLLVNGARDTAIETWLQAVFPVGSSV